jgi:hypothetical protein
MAIVRPPRAVAHRAASGQVTVLVSRSMTKRSLGEVAFDRGRRLHLDAGGEAGVFHACPCRAPGPAGQGSKGQRWYAWAWIATASPRHALLIRRHLKTGELAFHYCYVPDGQRGTA